MTTYLYQGTDPTVLAYNLVEEGNACYAGAIVTDADGTLKQIGFYSPSMAGTGTKMPDYVGLFEADNTTALLEVTPVTWSGAEGSGWVYATVPDTAITAGHHYFPVIAISPGLPMKQAYLYGDPSQVMIPHSSADGHITTLATPTSGLVNGPNGPLMPYHNGATFSYPDTPAQNPLNWLIDVGIDFGPSTPPSITSTMMPDAVRQYAYSSAIAETGGVGSLTWSITAGGLPPGLSLNVSTGTVSGTPTTLGSYSFTVHVTDSAAQSDSKGLAIDVVVLTASLTGASGGVSTYSVTSGMNNTANAGPQDMRVLPPASPAPGKPHAFLWVLPVEPGQGTTFGDGIAYMQSLGVHDAHNVTCIMPGFPVDPWYADNDTDPQTQQSQFMADLVAWATSALGSGAEKHYLIGFSKSGFGGQLLFWQHNALFEKVASWDAACDYQTLAQYDGATVIGTQGHLDAIKLYDPNLAGYKGGTDTGTRNRIWLGAGVNLVTATSDYSDRLTADGIAHTYAQAITDVHNWVTTPPWVPVAIAALFSSASGQGGIMGAALI